MSEYKGHWPEFEQQVFVIPPVELTNSFVSKIESFISEMIVLEKENVKLKESRDKLLAKLI
jgi:restriction endonuclease S subunit